MTRITWYIMRVSGCRIFLRRALYWSLIHLKSSCEWSILDCLSLRFLSLLLFYGGKGSFVRYHALWSWSYIRRHVWDIVLFIKRRWSWSLIFDFRSITITIIISFIISHIISWIVVCWDITYNRWFLLSNTLGLSRSLEFI
jgi:hypothetical protein